MVLSHFFIIQEEKVLNLIYISLLTHFFNFVTFMNIFRIEKYKSDDVKGFLHVPTFIKFLNRFTFVLVLKTLQLLNFGLIMLLSELDPHFGTINRVTKI